MGGGEFWGNSSEEIRIYQSNIAHRFTFPREPAIIISTINRDLWRI